MSRPPSWITDLVLAQRDYERAKEKRDAAQAECDAAEHKLDEIAAAGRKWKEEMMALAWATLEQRET